MRHYMKPVGILVGFCLTLLIGDVSSASTDQVHGNWSEWVMVTNCSKSCGSGEKSWYRSCTNPTPLNGGDLCTRLNGIEHKEEEKMDPCNTEPCFDKWSEWDRCKDCTVGEETRVKLCGNATCTGAQGQSITQVCNRWNKTNCPGPCEDSTKQLCPQFAVCGDKSTDKLPLFDCKCTMGYKMNDAKTSCVRPPPTTATPRPIPTMEAAQKTIATVISKSASSVLIAFVSVTLVLFIVLRIFTPDRVIQMNMEIALVSAHICLMLPGSIVDIPVLCRIVSMLIHFCFTACYLFIMLEALHMYSLVAYVVKKDGMFSRLQNILIGWGLAAVVLMFSICFEYENYGAPYHCWLQMNTNLAYATFIPVICIVIITFTLIEAAGAGEYKPLKGCDKKQLLSARISQRTNLIILPFMIAHWMIGMLSDYEQNLALYSVFSILNGILGFLVFFFHSTNNQQVRAKLKSMYRSMCKRGSTSSHFQKHKVSNLKQQQQLEQQATFNS